MQQGAALEARVTAPEHAGLTDSGIPTNGRAFGDMFVLEVVALRRRA